jgi:putative drug exporter of the RND superfamily
MIAIVVALSFLVLLLAFRSVLLPVKAAVANLLSVGAA